MSSDTRALLGSRLLTAAVALLVVGGTVGAAVALGVGTPRVAGVENRFGPVDNETTTVETDLTVANPLPLGVRLDGASVEYTVSMNGIAMANGSKEGVGVDPGDTTLSFSTRMTNEKIPAWWASHVGNDERTTVAIDARVHSSLLGESVTVPQERTVETDLLSAFNSTEPRPVDANEPLVSDPVLYVNRTSAAWGEVTDRETPIGMEFLVYNPKPAAYTITELGYEVTMNDVRVGGGATDRAHVVPPRGTETIAARTAIENGKLDEWWVTHLRNDQVTDLRIDFYAKVELPTGTTVTLPLDELTHRETMETDIFGTKASGNASAEAGNEGGEGASTASTAEPGSGDESTDETATDRTTTATPTATTTADDGLLAVGAPRSSTR